MRIAVTKCVEFLLASRARDSKDQTPFFFLLQIPQSTDIQIPCIESQYLHVIHPQSHNYFLLEYLQYLVMVNFNCQLDTT